MKYYPKKVRHNPIALAAAAMTKYNEYNIHDKKSFFFKMIEIVWISRFMVLDDLNENV